MDAGTVGPWARLTLRPIAGRAFYQEAWRRALAAGRIYHRPALAPLSLGFFERVAGRENLRAAGWKLRNGPLR